jgi:hypothetical protein
MYDKFPNGVPASGVLCPFCESSMVFLYSRFKSERICWLEFTYRCHACGKDFIVMGGDVEGIESDDEIVCGGVVESR